MTSLPSIFVSHGAPTLPIEESPARRFLSSLPELLPERPAAILAVSAHWETDRPTVGSAAAPATIHDFFGFPEPLYRMRYPAPGAPDLAARAAGLLGEAGLPVLADDRRGLDHGAWVPLSLAWPAADIPVAPLSVQPRRGPRHHLALGEALRPLRGEGVLILASGSLTHDLSGFRADRDRPDAAEPEWVADFAAWIDAALTSGETDRLAGYRAAAPFAVRNHPTEEHLLPLFVAAGAGTGGARRLHRSVSHGALRMDAYAFD